MLLRYQVSDHCYMKFLNKLCKNLKLVCITAFLLPYTVVADDFTEMPVDAGRLEVFVECSRCHSMQIVNQQGLTRSAWEKLMVWMVEEQSMTAMDDDKEKLVVDYLSKHYSPEVRKEGFQARGRLRYP
jgi:hypothetical protein